MNLTEAHLEKYHCTEQRRNIYIACEYLNYYWDEDDVNEFDALWRTGVPIDWIARNFGRTVDEVFILALDRAQRGKIGYRQNGILGRSEGA